MNDRPATLRCVLRLPPALARRAAAAGRRTPRRAGGALLAVAAAAAATAAPPAETRWTAGAGAGRSFWDLGDNWSHGIPAADTTRVQLGDFDTTLRSGSFRLSAMNGSAGLSVDGGSLNLNSPGSSLGRLDLRGGDAWLQGPGSLETGRLQWSAGSLGASAASPLAQDLRVTVTGEARFDGAGAKRIGRQASLELRGVARWSDGTAATLHNAGLLHVAAGALFTDHADSADHRLVNAGGSFVNGGRYLKSGAAGTRIEHVSGSAGLLNLGLFTVQQGSVEVQGRAGGGWWRNEGTLHLDGGSYSVELEQGSLWNSGTIEVVGGRLSFATRELGLQSSGDWRIGAEGSVHLQAPAAEDGDPAAPASGRHLFTAGTFSNQGRVALDGGHAVFGPAALLAGGGRVEVGDGGRLEVQRGLSIGTLKLDTPLTAKPGGAMGYSEVAVDGGLGLQILHWGAARLSATRSITVSGPAELSRGAAYPAGEAAPRHGKRIDSELRLDGGASWDGAADLFGAGRV
ncbi:hypothetical protein OOT46_10730, partial [Aquabacterium sp. A7-Y]|uniref:hypothetical protein n=1 Tax=Aquabacterium sp. A7-Y TaxID=1349605 RepID=UPI00223E0C70